MGALRVLRRKVPSLTERILRVLARSRGAPLHYTLLAERLKANPRTVQAACWRLWQDGRLCWYEEGLYGTVRVKGTTMVVRPKR